MVPRAADARGEGCGAISKARTPPPWRLAQSVTRRPERIVLLAVLRALWRIRPASRTIDQSIWPMWAGREGVGGSSNQLLSVGVPGVCLSLVCGMQTWYRPWEVALEHTINRLAAVNSNISNERGEARAWRTSVECKSQLQLQLQLRLAAARKMPFPDNAGTLRASKSPFSSGPFRRPQTFLPLSLACRPRLGVCVYTKQCSTAQRRSR